MLQLLADTHPTYGTRAPVICSLGAPPTPCTVFYKSLSNARFLLAIFHCNNGRDFAVGPSAFGLTLLAICLPGDKRELSLCERDHHSSWERRENPAAAPKAVVVRTSPLSGLKPTYPPVWSLECHDHSLPGTAWTVLTRVYVHVALPCFSCEGKPPLTF